LAARLKLRKAFGVDRSHGERRIPGTYDVIALGFNYRMSELQAAIGIEQLKKLPGFLMQRERNYQSLSQSLARIPGVSQLLSTGGRFTSSYYCLSAIVDERLAARRHEIVGQLNARGVGTSVYYPQPVPRMTYYREKYGWRDGSFPNAARISDQSIALPVGPHLSEADMQYIGDAVRDVLKGVAQ